MMVIPVHKRTSLIRHIPIRTSHLFVGQAILFDATLVALTELSGASKWFLCRFKGSLRLEGMREACDF